MKLLRATISVARFCAAGFGALAVAFNARADDSHPEFLDRTIPNDIKLEPVMVPPEDGKGPATAQPMLKIPSFYQGIILLGQFSGKKVELSGDIGEWPHEHDEQTLGISYGLVKNEKVSGIFDNLCMFLDLDWRYDPARDTIFLTPRWLRSDARSGSELVKVVSSAPLVRWDKLPQGARNRVGGVGFILDPWRVAFDALLSKPENVGTAGTLRIYHNFHGEGSLMIFPLEALYSGRLVGDDGQGRTVVLIQQERMSNKSGAGDLAFYIFDDNGRFIHGGAYAIAGHGEAGMQKCSVTPGGQFIIDVGYGSFGMNPDHYQFQLQKDDFAFTGSIDYKGQKLDAAAAQKAFPYGKIVELGYDVWGTAASRPIHGDK